MVIFWAIFVIVGLWLELRYCGNIQEGLKSYGDNNVLKHTYNILEKRKVALTEKIVNTLLIIRAEHYLLGIALNYYICIMFITFNPSNNPMR